MSDEAGLKGPATTPEEWVRYWTELRHGPIDLTNAPPWRIPQPEAGE